MISCAISFLLGTSLGTVSTVGVALILIAKGGNMNINIAAGAIIAGAYFGDRCSPMSSSASLVVNLTKTNLYTNISNMFKTSIVPFVISVIIYFVISLQEPMNFMESSMNTEIVSIFQINWVILLPAIIILIFSIIKIDVKVSMIFSIIVALIPWNIAAFIPTTTMGVSSTGFIPYCFYLYLIPIMNILYLKILEIKNVNRYRYTRGVKY